METLDNLEQIKKIDKSSLLDSASLLPEQIEQAWQEVSHLKIPISEFKKAKNIVVAGMGGSALGALIIDSLSFEILKVPLEIIKGYHLPAYVGRNTLAIISSYSGNTQETISSFHEARKRNCQVFVISSGGKLANLAKKNSLPSYIFNPRCNPSKQPRMGLGYSIAAQLAVLARCDLLGLSDIQISETVNYLHQLQEEISPTSPASKNIAKKLAATFEDKVVVVISSEHLIGAAHAFKNMINENSKTFAVRFSLPEMNHHLLEGLTYPKENKKVLKFFFLESDIYDSEIKKRIRITKEVIEKNGISCLSLRLKGKNRLIQVFETIYLGGFVSGYLALLYGIDPTPIPWVDYFKKALAKS